MKTNKEFIEACSDKNIEPLSEYTNYRTNCTLKCLVCDNIWITKAGSIFRGYGCPKCGRRKSKETIKHNITKEQFIEKLNDRNDLLSDIEILGEYISHTAPLLVRCRVCSYEWESSPSKLYVSHGCIKCGHVAKGKKSRKTHDIYQSQIDEIYGDRITLLTQYITGNDIIQAKCNICGNIIKKKAQRLLARGCDCNYSKGEQKIKNLLISNNIDFVQQYSFDDLVGENGHKLRFDFAVFNNSTLSHLIEYDGIQHYKSFDIFGGDEKLIKQKKYDEIKNRYCINNRIHLIRIPYYNYNKLTIDILLKDVKQVIVLRTDYGKIVPHKGKLVAQAAHASHAFIKDNIDGYGVVKLKQPQIQWLFGLMTKIVCRVNSETELLNIADCAKAAGLTCHVITDAGLTEFGGTPTITCCAIGPDLCEKIDAVTGNLKLY